MSDKCYSVNGEEYHDDDQFILHYCEEHLKIGDKFTYFEGESKRHGHSDFISRYELQQLIESMSESAYEAAGDWSDNYLQSKLKPEVEQEFKKLISKFMDKHFPQPDFYTAINVKEVKAVWNGNDFTDIESDVNENISLIEVS